MSSIDVRGFSCPEPLIRTRNAINDLPNGERLEIMVDTVTSRENILRFLKSKGFTVDVKKMEENFQITAHKDA